MKHPRVKVYSIYLNIQYTNFFFRNPLPQIYLHFIRVGSDSLKKSTVTAVAVFGNSKKVTR